MDKTVTHAMQGLKIELIIRLDGNESHVLARDRFSDRLGVVEIILVGFYKWLHELPQE